MIVFPWGCLSQQGQYLARINSGSRDSCCWPDPRPQHHQWWLQIDAATACYNEAPEACLLVHRDRSEWTSIVSTSYSLSTYLFPSFCFLSILQALTHRSEHVIIMHNWLIFWRQVPGMVASTLEECGGKVDFGQRRGKAGCGELLPVMDNWNHTELYARKGKTKDSKENKLSQRVPNRVQWGRAAARHEGRLYTSLR